MAQGSDNPAYPYASTGKKTAADPLRLDKGNVYKGNLHYVAEFVPAAALKNVSFDSGPNELQAVDEDEAGKSVIDEGESDQEREAVPEGITVRNANAEHESLKEAKKGHTKGARSVDSTRTTGTTATAETSRTSATADQPERGVEMSKEELLSHRASSSEQVIVATNVYLIQNPELLSST